MTGKITNKFVFYYAVLVSALIVSLMFFFNDLIRTVHMDLIKKDIGDKIGLLELMTHDHPRRAGSAENAALVEKVKKYSAISGLRVTLVGFDGRVIADSSVDDPVSMDNHLYRPEISDALSSGKGEAVRYSNTIKADTLYTAKKSSGMVIRLSRTLQEIEITESRTRRLVLLFGFITLAVAMIIVFFMTKRLTKPIREAMNFARFFSEGDYSRRILNYSDDEIGDLQRSLNKLADQMVEKMGTLLMEQEKLKVTIDNIHDGIAVIDRNKKIVLLNRATSTLLNLGSRTGGRFYYEIIRNGTLNAKIEYALAEQEKSFFVEELASGKTCEVHILPIREEKTLQGILLILHDITERKKIDRLKTDLVGNLSHELKTPVAILRGYLETMNDHLDDVPMCRDFIEKAIVNIDRQNSIINDMLKLNLLETEIHFPAEKINLGEIIDNCLNILGQKISNKGIAVTKNLAGMEGAVEGNRFLAEEIFFNIIDNAVNYNNREGKVLIESEKTGSLLAVSITDNGIGIPPESLGRIFERFYRVDRSRSRATGGTGLGLSIVKHAAELLGWKISVASSGSGTTFTIELPYPAP